MLHQTPQIYWLVYLTLGLSLSLGNCIKGVCIYTPNKFIYLFIINFQPRTYGANVSPPSKSVKNYVNPSAISSVHYN